MPDPKETPPQVRFSDLVAAAIKPVPTNLGNLIRREIVDGSRAQLLKGHEQALQGVAGTLSQ